MNCTNSLTKHPNKKILIFFAITPKLYLSNSFISVLPKLIDQCTSRAVPLEDLLSEKGFDKILDYIKSLDSVADLKVPKYLNISYYYAAAVFCFQLCL